MITYRLVTKEHRACGEKAPEDFGSLGKRFWNSRELGQAQGAIIAMSNGNMIGCLRYNSHPSSRGRRMSAFGTYIVPEFRGTGVGTKLWTKLIKKQKIISVDVCLTTRGAAALIRSLEKKVRNVEFFTYKTYL